MIKEEWLTVDLIPTGEDSWEVTATFLSPPWPAGLPNTFSFQIEGAKNLEQATADFRTKLAQELGPVLAEVRKLTPPTVQ